MSRQSGELPPGWALTELGALSERRGGGTPSRSVKRYFQGNIPWVTVADLPPIGAAPPTILASREAITDEAIAASSAKPIPKDSVVFATRVSVGKVAIAGCTLATNQDFRSLLPGSAHEPSYIAWFLSHTAQFNLPANQGTTIKGITTSKFDGIQVPLPPLAEQRRIVAKIEALQERSRRAREVLAEVRPLLEQFRQSVLAAAFRGDLTADWRAAHPDVEPASELLHRISTERRRQWEQAELAKYEAKGQKPPKNWKDNYKEPEPADDSDLPGLPDGWRWVSLDEVAYSMRSGNAKTSLKTQTNWPILRSSAVRPGLIDFGDINYMAEDESEESENVLSEGDLMVTRLSGSLDYVGVCAIVHGLNGRRIQYPDRLFRVRLCKSLVSKYIEFCFRHQLLRARLETSAKSSAGHQRISLSDLRSFRFPLPPYDEQVLIADTLTQVFVSALSIADECSAIAEHADLLCQAILAKAFRGELVPQDPSDEPASVLLERVRAQRKQLAESAKQTSNPHRTIELGKKSSRLEPQQLTLAEVLRTCD